MNQIADRKLPLQEGDFPTLTGVLVIGAGIAGLSLALRLPPETPVIVVTKGSLGESNTWYAQGGLAAAVGSDDDPELHFRDTMVAGAGLCDPEAVRLLVEDGPAAVRWLVERGTRFDREQSELALGKEAAHSRNRVLHAGGDATGAEIERSLVAELRSRTSATVLEHSSAVELLLGEDGSCRGARLQIGDSPTLTTVTASTTVLANGGAGRLWAVTSNPPGATGDGIAMAMRIGAAVADLEFTQFHPTVLTLDGVEPFLITEAIRGEGAYLRDSEGNRFLLGQHELAELAPRDVVARAIQQRLGEQQGQPVYLDLRHLDREMVLRRFPTIATRLTELGLSLADDLIPVTPAAHYFMGGVAADTEGRTSIAGLLAIGEVSCTGVHGANRLASNSLLEGLVFGLRAADALARGGTGLTLVTSAEDEQVASPVAMTVADEAIKREIQTLMSVDVAVVRNAVGLEQALERLKSIARALDARSSVPAELANVLLLATEVTRSALFREESRGGHFRSDFPETLAMLDGQHQVVHLTKGSAVRRFGTLLQEDGQ